MIALYHSLDAKALNDNGNFNNIITNKKQASLITNFNSSSEIAHVVNVS